VYGHKFFQASVKKRVEFINSELKIGRFDLEKLTEDIFVNVDEIKEELFIAGYVFVPQINQFISLQT
jgi:hypothetical protein